jgi:hypothetical protein
MSLSNFDLSLAAAFGPALVGDEARSFYCDTPNAGITTLGGIATLNAALLSPLANAKLDVVSSSAADDLGSTGAEYLTLEGIDANNAEISEVVEMNGAGTQTTNATFKALNRAYVSQVGSGGVNAGTITISITSGAAIAGIRQAFMEASIGAFTVPAGKVAIPYRQSIEIVYTPGAADGDSWTLQVVRFNSAGLRNVIGTIGAKRSGGPVLTKTAQQVKVAAGETLAMVVVLDSATIRTRAECQFFLRDA